MTQAQWKYILERVINNAFDAAREAREHPGDAFYEGRRLACYEMLDTVKNELVARGQPLSEFGLDTDLENTVL